MLLLLLRVSTSIQVNWEEVPVIDQNGIITQYEVMYEPLETFDGQIATQSISMNASIFEVLLKNLQEYVEYNIVVRAYTSVGEGPFSTALTVRTLEDGGFVLLLIVQSCCTSSTQFPPHLLIMLLLLLRALPPF